MKGGWLRLLLIALAFGIAAGGILLILGLAHNSQKEFRLSNGDIDYGYCFKLLASWALIGAAVGAAAFGLCELVRHLITNKGRGNA